MDSENSRELAQLAGLFGPLPAGIIGGVTAPDREISTGLATGAGSLAGTMGGSVMGGVAGAGLGYGGGGALLAKLLDESGSSADEIRLKGMLLGSQLGGALGGISGSYLGSGAGHDLLQKESSDMSQQQISRAFAIGALEKMAELNVNPGKFVQLAVQTQDPTMCKIASAVVELDQAVQREKVAGARADAVGDAVGEGLGRLGGIGNKLQELLGHSKVKQVAADADYRQAQRGLRGYNYSVSPEDEVAQLLDALKSRNRRMAGVAGAGLLGAGGAAGGAVYGLGDADTLQNQAANLSNEYLGTDFDTQSRLSALLESLQG